MGSILGIKYKDSTFKPISNAWDTVTDSVGSVGNTVSKSVSNAWDTVTDSVGSVGNTVSKGVSNGLNSITKTVENVGSVGLSALRKYWYIPVVVGGVVVGFKLIGLNNTKKLISSLATMKQ